MEKTADEHCKVTCQPDAVPPAPISGDPSQAKESVVLSSLDKVAPDLNLACLLRFYPGKMNLKKKKL